MTQLVTTYPVWAACLTALLATGLCCLMAAALTPRAWWQRPSVLGSVGLAGGSCLIGWWLWQFTQLPQTAALTRPPKAMESASLPRLDDRAYHTHQALNLRQQPGTDAALRATLPVASIVRPTGQRAGDWWQVTTQYGTGWVSSLWLRQHASPLPLPHQAHNR